MNAAIELGPEAAAAKTLTATVKPPRIWGLSELEVHDAYWRSRGVQCVRPDDPASPDRHADFFLLLDRHQMVLFELPDLIDKLIWSGALVTRLRIVATGTRPYLERIVVENGLVLRIERTYRPGVHASTRVVLTTKLRYADLWRTLDSVRTGWTKLRAAVPKSRIDSIRVLGGWTGAVTADSRSSALNEIVSRWPDPDRAIAGIEQVRDGIWRLRGEKEAVGSSIVGPVWLGAAHTCDPDEVLVGPVCRTDGDGSASSRAHVRSIFDIFAGSGRRQVQHGPGRLYPLAKRAFDIAVSALALLILSPLFALVALAIVMETGFPVFFRHRRQTRGGAAFGCVKFRTMHVGAERHVPQLSQQNVCDGPQVFIPNDPRVTRVGHILRRTYLDELPQLWNVLMGQMSIVGPRPSPERENQCCPAWRDLRLSVRSGITGLWQVKRTRAQGDDFQEWIRYDIEYVRSACFWLDMMICLQTARILILGRKP